MSQGCDGSRVDPSLCGAASYQDVGLAPSDRKRGSDTRRCVLRRIPSLWNYPLGVSRGEGLTALFSFVYATAVAFSFELVAELSELCYPGHLDNGDYREATASGEWDSTEHQGYAH